VRGQDNVGSSCTLDANHNRQTTASNGCLQNWNNQVCVCSCPAAELFKLKNKRSGYYLVGGRHAASCGVFANSHEVGQCPLDDASDAGFFWSVDSDGRITNNKNGFSLHAQSGESLQLLQNAAGDDSFKWIISSDNRIENQQFKTFLCAGAWGEHPKDTRVRNLEWTDANKQLNTNYVPVGYTGFEWVQVHPVDQCIESCKSKGHCCNDPSVGSNQYLSCAQACTIRSLGTPVAECNNVCDESRKCDWTVDQNTYGACSVCADLTSSCPHGVQDTTPCHDGCNFAF